MNQHSQKELQAKGERLHPRNTGGRRPKGENGRGNHRRWFILALVLILFVAAILFGTKFYQKAIEQRQYPLNYVEIIFQYAEEYELDPYIICGVIHTESKFDAKAVSSVGARGLMQVMPDTGAWIAQKMGIKDFEEEQLFDPDMNIRMGCWYLNYLFSLFPNKPDVVFAAYNTGPGRISGWLKQKEYNDGEGNLINIPYNATRKYIEKVNHATKRYREIYILEEALD